MVILPAIDLKDGKCVRLYKGDFSTVHQVAEDPLETALSFAKAGAKHLHVVDLDGALDGKRKNAALVKRLVEGSGLLVELGGGLRNMEQVDEVLSLGVFRAVIGSAAVTDPDFVIKAAQKYGKKIAVGIDALNGIVKISGWTEDSGIGYLDFAKKMESLGVKTLIFTDIDADGTLQGPSIDKLSALKNAVSCEIIASGGVSRIEDIDALKSAAMDGAIIGKAIYAGTIDLKAALEMSGG